jgi:signal transduction histidine kinase
LNLINNAAQALDGEGHIWLTTSADNETVTVSIRDDGAGIPEDVRARIFDPFFTTKDVGEGTGMGLSIAYRILEQHQATIDVRSKPGQGTEFLLRFPIQAGGKEGLRKTA